MKHALLILVLLSFIACKPKDTPSAETTPMPDHTSTVMSTAPGLRMLWNTDKILTTAESVLYDKANNLIYVSCINGVPADKKDNDGFIARVGLDGRIITLKWATGLSAPKGMAIAGNTLYVTDIDRLVAIDMATGKISQSWKVEGASYLNDIAASDQGTLYFTDSNSSTIYAMMAGNVTKVHADAALGGSNGIYVKENQLMLAGSSSGQIFRLDIPSLQKQMVADSIPGADGIEPYGDGWLVSNWNGEVYYIDAVGDVLEILDSREARLNAADIEIIPEKNLLLIPTFFGNTVTAYELMRQ